MNKVQQQAQDKLVTAIAFLENAQAQGVAAEHEEILSDADAFALLRSLQHLGYYPTNLLRTLDLYSCCSCCICYVLVLLVGHRVL